MLLGVGYSQNGILKSTDDVLLGREDCEDGYVIDCADDDCCPISWIGDGYADCEDQQWDCDLTCYENDGGDCDDDNECDEGYNEINGNCYYQFDLDVLNTFINNSPDINPILDTNNNGNIEPLEFCSQTWSNGRLILLNCGPIIIDDNYNWLEISGEVPPTIKNWNEIEVLNMSYNNLYGQVPEDICELN